MFKHIIVPIDGSRRAWAAARLGATIADSCAADVELVHVVDDDSRCERARRELGRELEAQPAFPVEPAIVPLVPSPASDGSIGATIAAYSEAVEGSLVVMSSTGRGRAASVLGSTADDVLRAMFGPVVVVGPHVLDVDSFTGDIVVPVDGSEYSETVLPLAAAWGMAFGATPWIVEVLTEQVAPSGDVLETSYAHRLADDLRVRSHHDVEYEVLHGRSPADAIAAFSDRTDVRLIMMATHGRTGLQRLTMGSVASSVVHRATVPVVLSRPPAFGED